MEFGNDYARNVIIFGVDNSSPSHASNLNFLVQFCLGSISNGFSAIESREVSLNGNVYDFSVNYSSFDKSDLLNIHKQLTAKDDIK